MKKIYTDTSVIGGCFDNKFREDSLALFAVFKTGSMEIIFSDLSLMELAPVRQQIKNKLKDVPPAYIIEAQSTAEVFQLAERYIRSGTLTQKNYHDALHIALATVYKADALATWNEIKTCNAINLQMGYKPVEILTPDVILKTNSYEKCEKL
jgi:predicted nucleic acid-binding protein